VSKCLMDRDSVRFGFGEVSAAGMALALRRSPERGNLPRLARFEIPPHENAGKRILVCLGRSGNRVRHCLS
jgi:hypothetical protein